MAWQAFFDHLVIGIGGRGHQRHAGLLQTVPGLHEIIANQGNVLDALTVEAPEELFDLAFAMLALLVEGDADLAIRSGQGA